MIRQNTAIEFFFLFFLFNFDLIRFDSRAFAQFNFYFLL